MVEALLGLVEDEQGAGAGEDGREGEAAGKRQGHDAP